MSGWKKKVNVLILSRTILVYFNSTTVFICFLRHVPREWTSTRLLSSTSKLPNHTPGWSSTDQRDYWIWSHQSNTEAYTVYTTIQNIETTRNVSISHKCPHLCHKIKCSVLFCLNVFRTDERTRENLNAPCL